MPADTPYATFRTPSGRPRDDKSLRLLLLTHRADTAFRGYLWDAYQRVQATDTRLVEWTARYQAAVDEAVQRNWFIPQLHPAVQRADATLTAAAAQYATASHEYERLLRVSEARGVGF